MGDRVVMVVEILAVHVACGVCGDAQRIDQPQHADAFTQRVLEPLLGWWTGHLAPQLVMVEVTADGQYQEWTISDVVDAGD